MAGRECHKKAKYTNLLADEKHAKAHGDKWYVATTVAQACVLGAAVSQSTDAEGWQLFAGWLMG